uniref:Scaffolding anchor of CK1 domain-containing protein n=1 Tax=Oncorhynchus kisutch TaxID=8019 RepID=A0A8C7N842_ONCKI
MALSQIQCLDENNDQRLALETLLRDGRDAFNKFLHATSLRCFLSDQEVDQLTGAVEVYDPASELRQGDSDSDELPLSLQYWPELSDCSLPRLDLGWPDCASYRGVTRVTVYAQPPLDGHTHIKEMVRKTIAQAQKVRRGGLSLGRDPPIHYKHTGGETFTRS